MWRRKQSDREVARGGWLCIFCTFWSNRRKKEQTQRMWWWVVVVATHALYLVILRKCHSDQTKLLPCHPKFPHVLNGVLFRTIIVKRVCRTQNEPNLLLWESKDIFLWFNYVQIWYYLVSVKHNPHGSMFVGRFCSVCILPKFRSLKL